MEKNYIPPVPPDQLTIGQRLLEERLHLKMTQEKMAKEGGVSKRTQGNYESDSQSPAGGYLSALASFHGLDVQYVLTGTHSTNMHEVIEGAGKNMPSRAGTLNKHETEVVLKFRELSRADQRHLMAILDALANKEG